MDSGQAATTVSTTVLTVQLSFTITLQADLVSFDTAELARSFAALYGVASTAVELSAVAGSTVLEVRITSDEALALANTINATDAAELTSMLGMNTSAPTAVHVESVGVETLVETTAACPRGYWCVLPDSRCAVRHVASSCPCASPHVGALPAI